MKSVLFLTSAKQIMRRVLFEIILHHTGIFLPLLQIHSEALDALGVNFVIF